MRKWLLIIGGVFLVSCAPDYLEKNSEALSQGVYATSDSIKVNRFDLAKKYSDQITKLVTPPKKKIKIDAIVSKDGKNKYVILPKDSDGQVIVVGSKEYDNLIKSKDIAKKLAIEVSNLDKFNKSVEEQLRKEKDITNKLILDNQNLKVEVQKKDARLWKYISIIMIESFIILGYIAWKLKVFFV